MAKRNAGPQQEWACCTTNIDPPCAHKTVGLCTVHASPDCVDPDGAKFHGRGWDHGGTDLRIECSPCAALLSS